MTDRYTVAATDSPARPTRLYASDLPWPHRPGIMAALCAIVGLALYGLTYQAHAQPLALWRTASATALVVATIAFVLGVERRRWHWALGFALLWGAAMGLIAHHSAGYNSHGTLLEWPFWSGLLAALVATPLFQTRRDVAPDWRFWRLWQMPYDRVHSHAWTDAVIGAASLAFVAITFLLVLLIGQMFHLIGIDLIQDLLNDEWFGWMLAGAAFGGAVGLLRERDRLVATLQRLVMIVLAVLAPVLAAALLLFLVSLIGTGMQKLWASGVSTAALMMAAAAFAVLLANAVIGNGSDERAANPLLRWAAPVLAVAVLPLAAIALYAMYLRITQHGWTPDRIWGAIAGLVALAYGVVGLWAVIRGRRDFDDLLRPLQQRLAIGVALVALFLALPFVDFGAISTRDQLARLTSGAVPAERFDWAAIAFDFGPAGRAALQQLARGSDKARAGAATAALEATDRWYLAQRGPILARPLAERLRVIPESRPLPPPVSEQLRTGSACPSGACVALWLDEGRVGVLHQDRPDGAIRFHIIDTAGHPQPEAPAVGRQPDAKLDLSKAQVKIEAVQQRRITVDGVPASGTFD